MTIDKTTTAGLVLLAGVILWTHYDRPTPVKPTVPAAIDPETLGHEYGPILGRSYGDAWLTFDAAIRSGAKMSDADAKFKAAWAADLAKQYKLAVSPIFAAIVADGVDDPTPAQRDELSKAVVKFAKGLGSTGTPPGPAVRDRFLIPPIELVTIILMTMVFVIVIITAINHALQARAAQSRPIGQPSIQPVPPSPGASR